MKLKEPQQSASGLLLALTVLVNGIVLSYGFTLDRKWYVILLVTIPALTFILFRRLRTSSDARRKLHKRSLKRRTDRNRVGAVNCLPGDSPANGVTVHVIKQKDTH